MLTEELIQYLQSLFQKATDIETLTLFQAIVQWSAIVLSALALGLSAYLGTLFALISNVPLLIAPVLGVV